ncbi:EAL domain-containing protein [Microbacteriaceae bacterium K1510]|nr:EAL domain-containing protein [Microbacteriaceae bacterium K1510]
MVRKDDTASNARGWRFVVGAGVIGFLLAFAFVLILDIYALPLGALPIALTAVCGALTGMLISGVLLARRTGLKLSEQNKQLDGALNSTIQGLCMFDADDRLVLWNQRYIEMYHINPRNVRRGSTIRDVLEARRAAGTFPLDIEAYVKERKAVLDSGGTMTLTTEIADGRFTTVTYHTMAGGGWVAMHEDVTERVRAERALEHTRAFLDTIIENMPSPLIVKDVPSLRYILVNRAAEHYFGVSRSEILGKTVRDLIPDRAEMIEAQDRRLIETEKPVFLDEHAVVTPANGTRIVTATRLPVEGPRRKPQYLISLITDLTERKQDEQQLAHLAHHDPLTDLPNRFAFSDCIVATLDRARAADAPFAVLCIDLDRFKAINDVFGHATGDTLLREVARRLELVSEGAFLARIGGDEFAIITPTGAQPEGADTLTRRLQAAFVHDIDIGGHAVRVSFTMGVAIFPNDGADAATLMANAEAALFRAKGEARGSVRFFEVAMDTALRQKRALQQDLSTAIAHGEMALHYQPQAEINGRITGFEALVRWHHPRLGLVPPITFIPLAEESGAIVALGEWILRAACREAAAWPRPLRIGVNLSPVQFHHGDLPQLVHQVLLETGLPPERLELEITEGVLIGDFERALSVLRRLKNLGVRIAMDDFGTGYSSLSYLQSFPFDKIKIDRAFIANLGRSEQAAAIVRSVIALGRGLSLPVLAEGVETEAQLDFLASEGCDEVQGYFIGMPKPIGDYADTIGRVPMPRRPRKKRVATG